MNREIFGKPCRCDACGRKADLIRVVENMMGMDIWFCRGCKHESEEQMKQEQVQA
jgi:hypothetical protein